MMHSGQDSLIRLGSSTGDRQWRLWIPVYACVALMGSLRAEPCSNGPSLCVYPYWLDFWLCDYSNGFRRRGFLGTVARLLSPGHLDVVVVNALALLVCLIVIISTAVLVYKMSDGFWPRAVIAVLLASPLTAVFVEVLGDPLEIVFVWFLVCAGMMARATVSALRWLWCAAFCILGLLVHEAALFLFVPAILLMAAPTRRPRAGHYAAFAVACAVLLGPLLWLDSGARPVNDEYRAVNSMSGEILPRTNPILPFSQLLRDKREEYFGSPMATARFAMKFPRTWTAPCLALVLMLGIVCATTERMMLWRFWLFLTVCSAPLYVIAGDWGRFSAITFWLAVIVTVLARRRGLAPSASADPRSAPDRTHMVLPEPSLLFGVVASALLGMDAINPVYRFMGMPLKSVLILPPLALAWLGWRTMRKS